jgi:glutamyl-tRNA synthetase
MTPETTLDTLTTAYRRLKELADFSEESLEELFRPLARELGLKAGQLFGSIRTAVSGLTATPPLFQMMVVLGRERTLRRIEQAIEKLKTAVGG